MTVQPTKFLGRSTESSKRKNVPLLVFIGILVFMFLFGQVFARMETIGSVVISVGAGSDIIVVYGDVEVSNTGISFWVQNLSIFDYRTEYWMLHKYNESIWELVPIRSGFAGTIERLSINIPWQGQQQREISFEDRHGELTPGRYVFRQGHRPLAFGDVVLNDDIEFIQIEFVIR